MLKPIEKNVLFGTYIFDRFSLLITSIVYGRRRRVSHASREPPTVYIDSKSKSNVRTARCRSTHARDAQIRIKSDVDVSHDFAPTHTSDGAKTAISTYDGATLFCFLTILRLPIERFIHSVSVHHRYFRKSVAYSLF